MQIPIRPICDEPTGKRSGGVYSIGGLGNPPLPSPIRPLAVGGINFEPEMIPSRSFWNSAPPPFFLRNESERVKFGWLDAELPLLDSATVTATIQIGVESFPRQIA